MAEIRQMSDIRRYIAANDRMRVHLREPWQVAYWTRVLDVDEQELRRIVAQVGNKTHHVRERLTQLRAGVANPNAQVAA